MTKVANVLTTIEIECARMLVEGFTEQEIAESVNRSKRWLTSLKRRPEFIESVKNLSQAFENSVVQTQEEQWLNDIKAAKLRMSHVRKVLFQASDLLMDKLLKRLETLDESELKSNNLPQSLKATADSFMTSIELDQQITGIDKLISEIKNIKKIAGTINITPSNLGDGLDSSD